MTSRFPILETVLSGVAVASLVTLWLLPPTPYLAPILRPYVLGLSLAWTLWCLARLDRVVGQWHRWHVSPTLVTTPRALRSSAGVTLGQAFRWEAAHVQQLELALRQQGGLPAASGPRGGYPALHAVGQAEEQPLVLSWDVLTRHVGILGTTGSGKSRVLESVIAQVIGE